MQSNAVEIMIEMGFSRRQSEMALKATGHSSINSAIDYLLNKQSQNKNHNHNHNNNNNNNNHKNHIQPNQRNKTTITTTNSVPVASSSSPPTSANSSPTDNNNNNNNNNISNDMTHESSSLPWYSKSIAVLIACEHYPHMKQLQGATSSVSKLGHILKSAMAFDQVHTLIDDQVADSNTVLDVLRSSLKFADSNTRVVIVLSGHAKVEKTRKSDQEYFCCYHYDAKDKSPSNKVKNALYYRDLLGIIEEHCYAKHTLLLFDCHFSRKLLNRKQQDKHQPQQQVKQFRRFMDEDCVFVYKSGAPDESEEERDESSTLIDHLNEALITPWYTGDNNGYCTFYEISKHVKNQAAQTSTQTPVTFKYGYLNECKGQILFKLPVENEVKDTESDHTLFEMKDTIKWHEINEYWPDGLYLSCWNNGLSPQAIDLGWIKYDRDELFGIHSFVAHKCNNMLTVYEFCTSDTSAQIVQPCTELSLEKLALGTNGCVVATRWTISGKTLKEPTKVFSIPTECNGYLTDLSKTNNNTCDTGSENDTLQNLRWLRVTERSGFNLSMEEVADRVLNISSQAEEEEEQQHDTSSPQAVTQDKQEQQQQQHRRWTGHEIYRLCENNCHNYSQFIICHLLAKSLSNDIVRRLLQ